jgi:hypothetical protein
LILFSALAEIYFNHQVYLYNPIFGYFPGTVFDEGLSVSGKLALYRLFNVLYFLWIILIITNNIFDSSFRRKIFLVYVLIVGGTFYYFSPVFGFTTTTASLNQDLPHKIQSDHFVIHSSGKIDESNLKFLTISSEFFYNELSKFFQENLSGRIDIYLFDSRTHKKALFGSENADVAKPWLNSVYTSLDNWESTLKHELAHCFSAQFGTGPFKIASGFNISLIEGVAEAADGFYDGNYIHDLASIAFNNGYRIDVAELIDGSGFFSKASTLTYVYSGSFCKYLIENYGVKKIKEFYSNNDFKETYHIQIVQLIPQYYEFLKSLPYSKRNAKADYYFGRKSLIEKTCPRYISDKMKSGWSNLRKGDYQSAKEIFEAILKKSINSSALVGLAECYHKQGSTKESISLLEKHLADFKGTSDFYDLSFILAGYFAKTERIAEADTLFKFIERENPNEMLQVLSELRLELIGERILKRYLDGSDLDKYNILKSLNAYNYKYYTFPSMIELSESLEEDYSVFMKQFNITLFDYNKYAGYALFRLSETMMRNLDFQKAKRVAQLSVRFKNNSELSRLFDWNFRKVDWLSENGNKIISNLKIIKAD